ncbi:MAG: trypsin-like peptidase domain-containing protein [Peptoniphilaceae bacterium]|nr:trypsin-like peptidase domain-containing protein [Peptoniphilaceae bacterium]MDD7382977.1 trypsin-like peptidase domain-containing protein [Peptoniphilaceae bacterium]MDY3737728.1 trypsin-like peptidase domain-containing protein [Peptoniphilaceae bacterium]
MENNNNELKKLIRDEVRRNTPKEKSSKGYFLSGLFGVLIGAVIVIFAVNFFAKSPKSSSENPLVEDYTSNKDSVNDLNTTTTENKIVKKSIDSVVGITTLQESDTMTFFGKQTGYAEGLGSGVIISKDGYILTNSHVVADGDALKLQVMFSDNKTVDGKLIWNDSTLDLAIVKVEKDNLKPITLADSDKVEIGDKAVAIGNPLGLDLQSTVTSGIISGLNRSITLENGSTMDGLMQTDAAINSGNSGGALLNENGDLIGINTAKAGNSDGIGFAIPINTAKTIVDQVLKTGKFESVYLGISGTGLDIILQFEGNSKEEFGTDKGVYVQDVYNEDSGLKIGDVIVGIDDYKVEDMNDLKKALLNYKLGDSAKVDVYREGKKEEINLKFTMTSKEIENAEEERNNLNEDNESQGQIIPFPFGVAP